MKTFIQKFKYFILGALLVIGVSTTYATNQILVPSAPTNGYMLTSTTTGAYLATTTTPLHIGSIYATSTTANNYFAGTLTIATSTAGCAQFSSTGLVWSINTACQPSLIGTFSPNSIITSNSSGTLTATSSQLTVGNLIATTTTASSFVGNVGIGTTAPGAKLDVNGNIQLSPYTSNVIIKAAGNDNSSGATAGSLTIQASTYVSGPGPQSGGDLNLKAGTAFTGGSDTAGNVNIYAGGNHYVGGATLGTINFYTEGESDAINQRMVILNNGNVGIGTTGPTAKLDVTSANVAVAGGYPFGGQLFLHTSDAVGIDKGAQIGLGGENGNAGVTPYVFGTIAGRRESAGTGYAGYLQFSTTMSNSSISEAMRITSAGNVGIGTTGPGSKLQVSGAFLAGQNNATDVVNAFGTPATAGVSIIDSGAEGQYRGGSLGFGGLLTGGSTSPYLWSVIKGGKENATAGNYAGYLGFWTIGAGSASTEQMRITSSGNVGIGTTTPASLLHVSAGATATTTVEFGARSTSAHSCFNVRNTTGDATSFYFVGTTMIVEANLCR